MIYKTQQDQDHISSMFYPSLPVLLQLQWLSALGLCYINSHGSLSHSGFCSNALKLRFFLPILYKIMSFQSPLILCKCFHFLQNMYFFNFSIICPTFIRMKYFNDGSLLHIQNVFTNRNKWVCLVSKLDINYQPMNSGR